MRYNLIGDNDLENPIKCFLSNRNITEELFHVSGKDEEDYSNYDNMQQGVELLDKHIQNNSNILVIKDSDVDGAVSSSILINYIRKVYNYKNIRYKIHTGKQHGLSNDITIENDIGLVIIPDAGSNDFKQIKELKERNIDVLILDHHLCDLGYSKDAIVINNQLSNNVMNKNLSGVGVVYKFLKALDDYLFENKADKYLDLVSLGNVADVMDLKEKETRYYVYKGLENINNPFLKALIENNSFDLDGKYNIDKLGWVIAPKLNGTIRSGTQEEKTEMFKAFISDDYDYCLKVADMCKKVKQRQDRLVKNTMEKIKDKLDFHENDKCILYELDKKVNRNFIGLVAQKISSIYSVPVLLYKEYEDILRGSARSCENITLDLRNDLLNSGLVTMAQGHESAFGVSFKKENELKIKEYLNELYKDKEVVSDKNYQVDFDIDEDDVYEYWVDELASLENECGNGIDFPLVHINNIHIHITEENIKGRINIVFYINDVKIIKKYATKVLRESLMNKDSVIEIIGKPTIDSYKNKGQLEIVDLEEK